MLRFDLAGKLIEPSRMKKTIGGDIDRDGLPDKVSIPTTGNWSGVTVTDDNDGAFGKQISRTTLGKMAVTNEQANLITGNVEALHLKARVAGGGSGATTGATERRFLFGFRHPTAFNEGAYVAYLPPILGESVTGTYITVVKGGVKKREPINYQCNNPGEHFALDLWVSRNRQENKWYVTLMEGDQVRIQMPFDQADLDINNRYLVPFVEWEWEDDSGYINATICQFEHTVYWRF